jgi:DNA-binding transcriptional MerR regulator
MKSSLGEAEGAAVRELPRKDVYKLSEVCQYTDTQPYVLRFWESEFPQLNPGKSASGQRLYRRRDIDLVNRIKELLYDEEFTLERARQQLSDELAGGKPVSPAQRAPRRSAAPAAKPAPSGLPRREELAPAAGGSSSREIEMVPRQRYEDAVDEIDHLRLALKEAERACRKAQAAEAEARGLAERESARAEQACRCLERVLELLD